jgi:hypothetical protein
LGRTNKFDGRLLEVVVGRVIVFCVGNTSDVAGALFLVRFPVSGETEAIGVDGNCGTGALVAFGETGDATASKEGLVVLRASAPPTDTLVAEEMAGELGEEPFGLRLDTGSDSQALGG